MHTTQEILNRCLWLAGLLLQAALLVALVTRREARRFPAFTLLIVFYTARTTLLYALSGHVAAAAYGLLYGGLSWIDLALQMLVAAEIVWYIVRQRDGWTWRVGGILLLLLALAGWASWLAGIMIRPYPRIPVDRGQIFTSCFMLLLLVWVWWRSTFGPARRIVEGFALYGLVILLSEPARIHAFAHRNARDYLAWSYAPAVAYLDILVFWLLTVGTAGRPKRDTQAALLAFPQPVGPDASSAAAPRTST